MPSDGSQANRRHHAAVAGTTAPNFGIAPAPGPTPSTNVLFTAAQQGVPSAGDRGHMPASSARCWRRSWRRISPAASRRARPASGRRRSWSCRTARFLVSGGANRGTLYHVPRNGRAGRRRRSSRSTSRSCNMAFDNAGPAVGHDGRRPAAAARPGDRRRPRLATATAITAGHRGRPDIRHHLRQHQQRHLHLRSRRRTLHAVEPRPEPARQQPRGGQRRQPVGDHLAGPPPGGGVRRTASAP